MDRVLKVHSNLIILLPKGESSVAVTLRLARHGTRSKPFYRIVAAEKSKKRDGRFIEVVGFYHPLYDPPRVNFKEDRVKHWLEKGAQATEKVTSLIKKAFPGVIEQREEARRKRLIAARRKRKERAKNRSKAV